MNLEPSNLQPPRAVLRSPLLLWSPARDSRLLVAPAACSAGSVAARCGLAKVVRSRRQRCLTEGLRLREFAPLSSNKQIERPQWSGSVAAMVSWRRLFFSASLAGRMHSFQTQRVSAPWRANPHSPMVHIFAIGRFRVGFSRDNSEVSQRDQVFFG